ncbi:MAG: hypothetical protein KJ043_02340 [Anaerolineae bacterium]|nr:hypothetical protein [Anaerolineae bacterium]
MKRILLSVVIICLLGILIGINLLSIKVNYPQAQSQSEILLTIEMVKSLTRPEYVLRTYDNELERFCVDIFVRHFQFDDIYKIDILFFANGLAVNEAYVFQSIIASFDPILTICVEKDILSIGENLLEIQFKPNASSSLISYQWIAKIESTPSAP